MGDLKTLQDNFLDYLLSNNTKITHWIADQGTLERHTRLGIYKNAYIVRLKKCIENDHEILANYLGEQLFDQLTSAYITTYPSAYTSLRQYCEHLPTYLSQHEPFKLIPILAEIATFERSMLAAFDAPDVDHRAILEDLQKIAAQDWPTIQLQFHPSVFLFEANWNGVNIWQALKAQQTPPAAQEIPNYWLIWRGQDRLTQFKNISPEARTIFTSFKNDNTLAQICDYLLEYLPEDQVAPITVEHLKNWLQLGIVHTINAASEN